MRVYRLLILLAFGLGGCRDSTAPAPTLTNTSIFGLWSLRSRNNDGSTYQTMLSYSPDLTFVRSWHSYGAGSAGSLGPVTAYVTTSGTYTVRGDSIFMQATVVRSWDRDFNGGAVIVTPVSGVSPYGFGGARVEVRNDSLVLHFLTYPADAPVETS